MASMKALFVIATIVGCAAMERAAADESIQLPKPAQHPVDFHREILPILANRCATCHASGRSEGGFSMETRTALLTESDTGRAVVPGKSGESLLIQLVAGSDPDRIMPKQGKHLTEQEVGLLRAWIDQGAAWDADISLCKLTMQTWGPRPVTVPSAEESGALHPIDRILAAYFRKHGVCRQW